MSASLLNATAILVDCQTTGPVAGRDHLLELGWGELSVRNRIWRYRKIRQIRPPEGMEITPRIQKITGISTDLLAAGGLATEVAAEFFADLGLLGSSNPAPGEHQEATEVVSRPLLVAHFLRFELPFLEELGRRRFGDGFILSNEATLICTHQLSRRLWPDLPRHGIRAVAGYLGHATPELKRAEDHLLATAAIWSEAVRRLQSQGIETWSDLEPWLIREASPGCVTQGSRRRSYPYRPDSRQLPPGPGVYRMERSGGGVLYVGKAKSLRRRVMSYFRPGARHAEHILEMLCQVGHVEFEALTSEVEAAVREADLIQFFDPPYNRALRVGSREIVFLSRDLQKTSASASSDCPMGPFESFRTFKGVAGLLAVPTAETMETIREGFFSWSEDGPSPSALAEAVEILRARHFSGIGSQSVRTRLEGIWKTVHAEARALSEPEPPSEEADAGAEPTVVPRPPLSEWSVEMLLDLMEQAVGRAGQMLLRVRFSRLLSDADVRWKRPSGSVWSELVFRAGKLKSAQSGVDASGLSPLPDRAGTAFEPKRDADLAWSSRMRVLTSELKRLNAEGCELEICFSARHRIPSVRLGRILELL